MSEDSIQPVASADENRCDHPVAKKTLGEIFTEACDRFEDESGETSLMEMVKLATEAGAQAVRLAVIEECARLVDQSAAHADWGHAHETMMGMLFRKQASVLRALKSSPPDDRVIAQNTPAKARG